MLALQALHTALDSFITDASSLFSGGELAAEVADVLQKVLADASVLADAVPVTATASDVTGVLLPAIPELQDRHEIAVRRGFTRLEPWIADVIVVCRSLVKQLPTLDDAEGARIVRTPPIGGGVERVLPSIGHLVGILDQLALAPSLQPANAFRLTRQVRQAFTPASDMAPRLLAAFKPAAAKTLYKAWGAIQTPPTDIQVYAMRVKAAPFGNNAPLKPVITGGELKDSRRVGHLGE